MQMIYTFYVFRLCGGKCWYLLFYFFYLPEWCFYQREPRAVENPSEGEDTRQEPEKGLGVPQDATAGERPYGIEIYLDF